MFTLKISTSNENPTETYPTCFIMMPSEIQAGAPRELERPRANTKVGSIKSLKMCSGTSLLRLLFLCMHTVNTYFKLLSLFSGFGKVHTQVG